MQVSKIRRGMVALWAGALLTSLALTTAAAPASAAGKVTCRGKVATIVGTKRGDVIYGTRRADVIAGLGGNDVIIGRGGNDIICGGKGADRLVGKAGFDRLYGNAGPDRLFGSNGPDKLFGGAGNDRLAGQVGHDLLNGGPGSDRCYQGQGSGAELGCEPWLLPLSGVLAVAYSDIDGLDGYSSGDIMIAKLVDTDGDGAPSPGDTVRMGGYPKNLGATALGVWTVKSHAVTGVAGVTPSIVQLSSTAGNHIWAADATFQVYSEGPSNSGFRDGLTGGVDDLLEVNPGSPSAPNDTVGLLMTARTTDDRFIDVAINVSAS
jgi:hypothetical protein